MIKSLTENRNRQFKTSLPELLILKLLQDQEMYGYEIVAAITAETGFVLAEGVVYPLLHALEKDGALKTRRAVEKGRPRIYYTVTARGLRRLFELTDEWARLTGAVQKLLDT